MPRRNKHFHTREPFHDDEKLTLQHADGPVGFLNPTRAHFFHNRLSKQNSGDDSTEVAATGNGIDKHADDEPNRPSPGDSEEAPAKSVRFLWRSRDNRKGRHALLVQRPRPGEEAPFMTPRRTSHPREVLKNVIRTFTCFPVWDISWLVAFIFTWGSVVWVMNGFFVWLPVVAPSTEFHNEITYAGGITAFIGAIIFFESGSILLIIEAVNANHSGCFGWAVEELFDEETAKPRLRIVANHRHCHHHHQNRRNFVGRHSAKVIPEVQKLAKGPNSADPSKTWQWFPSWHDLRTHYIYQLGFLAGLSQLCGATIFGVAGFTALPGINNHLTPQSKLNGAYWIPQVIGGTGFIISSSLYMLETQKKWYLPALNMLGWHIGFWNLIGAFGFTLSGSLGMAYGNSGAQYQAGLATFWGSWAFLIGSYLQLYESLDKHPVEEVPPMEDVKEANQLEGSSDQK